MIVGRVALIMCKSIVAHLYRQAAYSGLDWMTTGGISSIEIPDLPLVPPCALPGGGGLSLDLDVRFLDAILRNTRTRFLFGGM